MVSVWKDSVGSWGVGCERVEWSGVREARHQPPVFNGGLWAQKSLPWGQKMVCFEVRQGLADENARSSESETRHQARGARRDSFCSSFFEGKQDSGTDWSDT